MAPTFILKCDVYLSPEVRTVLRLVLVKIYSTNLQQTVLRLVRVAYHHYQLKLMRKHNYIVNENDRLNSLLCGIDLFGSPIILRYEPNE
jgi:hypothetical protein